MGRMLCEGFNSRNLAICFGSLIEVIALLLDNPKIAMHLVARHPQI